MDCQLGIASWLSRLANATPWMASFRSGNALHSASQNLYGSSPVSFCPLEPAHIDVLGSPTFDPPPQAHGPATSDAAWSGAAHLLEITSATRGLGGGARRRQGRGKMLMSVCFHIWVKSVGQTSRPLASKNRRRGRAGSGVEDCHCSKGAAATKTFNCCHLTDLVSVKWPTLARFIEATVEVRGTEWDAEESCFHEKYQSRLLETFVQISHLAPHPAALLPLEPPCSFNHRSPVYSKLSQNYRRHIQRHHTT